MQSVLLVDEQDQVIGTAEKMKAHYDGALHRAFSVLIFNSKKELLLQQRASQKYHSGGLWTNTCCGHPTNPENTLEDARQRLKFEMGICTEIQPTFNFQYFVDFGNGLFEHEIDHVFVGNYEGDIPFNADEVAEFKWLSLEKLEEEMRNKPEIYTEWFKILYPRIKEYI